MRISHQKQSPFLATAKSRAAPMALGYGGDPAALRPCESVHLCPRCPLPLLHISPQNALSPLSPQECTAPLHRHKGPLVPEAALQRCWALRSLFYLWMVSSSSLVFTSSSCICFFIASSSSEAEDGAPSSSHLSRSALDWGSTEGHSLTSLLLGGPDASPEHPGIPRRGGRPHLEMLQLPPVVLQLPPLVLNLCLTFSLLLDGHRAGISPGLGQHRELPGGNLHPSTSGSREGAEHGLFPASKCHLPSGWPC